MPPSNTILDSEGEEEAEGIVEASEIPASPYFGSGSAEVAQEKVLDTSEKELVKTVIVEHESERRSKSAGTINRASWMHTLRTASMPRNHSFAEMKTVDPTSDAAPDHDMDELANDDASSVPSKVVGTMAAVVITCGSDESRRPKRKTKDEDDELALDIDKPASELVKPRPSRTRGQAIDVVDQDCTRPARKTSQQSRGRKRRRSVSTRATPLVDPVAVVEAEDETVVIAGSEDPLVPQHEENSVFLYEGIRCLQPVTPDKVNSISGIVCAPEPASKGPDKHSPLSAKIIYRVGLSKRARIEPLLRSVKK